MPSYQVQILDAAAKDLSKLGRPVASRIVKRLRWLADRMDQIDPEPLHGDLSGFFKLRVGDHRVVYELLGDERTIAVHAVGHRREIYRSR